MKINQLPSLNRQARKFLLNNCISTKSADVNAFFFTGYLNGESVERTSLKRVDGQWMNGDNFVLSLEGELGMFGLVK